MDDPVKERGIVDFPEGGDGVVFQFRLSDLAQLQKQFGDQWFAEAVTRMDRADIHFLEALLKHGPKTADGKPFQVKLENIDLRIADLYERCIDGLYVAMWGRTLIQQMDRIAGQIEDAVDKAEELSPRKGVEAILADSAPQPIAQG